MTVKENCKFQNAWFASYRINIIISFILKLVNDLSENFSFFESNNRFKFTKTHHIFVTKILQSKLAQLSI